MDVEGAIDRLPETHAAAVRLRARGFDHDGIAKALGVQPLAIAALLGIADAKLEALTASDDQADDAQ